MNPVNIGEKRCAALPTVINALCRKVITSVTIVLALVAAVFLTIGASSANASIEFIRAAESGDIVEIQRLLSDGADVDFQSGTGATALMRASQNGHTQVVSTLLNAGADPNRHDKNGLTALIVAANNGHVAVTKVLLANGAEVNTKNNTGTTALMFAADKGYFAIAQVLLAHNTAVDAQRNDGTTALFFAAKGGNSAIVKVLLDAGANPKIKNTAGKMAENYAKNRIVENVLLEASCTLADSLERLIPAAKAGNLQKVKIFIACGVEGSLVDRRNSDGLNALYWAARNGRPEVVLALIAAGASVDQEYKESWTPLIVGSNYGRADVVAILLKAGASVDLVTDGRDTALTQAAAKGHEEVVSALISAGASVDYRRSDGSTALIISAQEGHVKVVEALLAAGASVDRPKVGGYTPLLIAAEKGHAEIVSALLAHGAKVDGRDSDGVFALFVAAREGNGKVVSALISGGASVDRKFASDLSALHISTMWGKTAAVRTLIEHGANVDLRDRLGETALIIAAFNGHSYIVSELLSAGADPRLKAKDGRSAIDAAKTRAIRVMLQKAANVGLPEPRTIKSTLSIASKREVCQLQEALTLLGYSLGPIDGIAGKQVRGSVKAYLDSANLTETADLGSLQRAIKQEYSQLVFNPGLELVQDALGVSNGSADVKNYQSPKREADLDALRKVSKRPASGSSLTRRTGGHSPFKVKTPTGDKDYFIKLVDPNTGFTEASFFVRGGSSAKIGMPFGEFELRYATGNTFFSRNCLFGSETQFYKADTILDFSFSGNQYTGHAVELIPQVDGNLSSSRMNVDEW